MQLLNMTTEINMSKFIFYNFTINGINEIYKLIQVYKMYTFQSRLFRDYGGYLEWT